VSDVYVHTTALMGTVVTFQVVGHGGDAAAHQERVDAVDRAVEWFRSVEACCSRFDEASELRRLTATVGHPVPATEMLFSAVNFALALAHDTDGAFDPTVGRRMEARGFDRHHRTGARVESAVPVDNGASYRDVELDAESKTVTLLRPLTLDLGAVAKGLAVDLAARELAALENFSIDAGGDLYLGGHNPSGEAWSVGIRHPREPQQIIDTIRASNEAVCTSGDYERRSDRNANEHHIMDPRTGASATALASVTAIGPSAMVADALATAAFVLGPTEGVALLQRHGLRGLLLTPSLDRFETHAA
jgi:thiamine biosynthesis lipoprotein